MRTYRDVVSNKKLKKFLARYPLILSDENQDHVLVFRRTLEWFQTYGIWSGQMPEACS